MGYESFIALRYLKSSKKSFLRPVAAISALGVILGVTALTATVSVAGGFEKAWRDRLLGVYPHILLRPASTQFREYREVMASVEQVPGVEWVGPYVHQPMMVYTPAARSMVLVRGIDVERSLRLPALADYVAAGELTDLVYDPLGEGGVGRPGMFLGAELARVLRAEVGSEVTVVTHLRGIGYGLGPSQMAPTSARFRVAGVFDFGYEDFDAELAITDLRALQELLNRGDVVTGIDVRLSDPMRSQPVADEITGRLTAGGYQALTWQVVHRNLFESLKYQKIWLSLIMTAMVVVASFNILSTLILMVLDKTREIAILKSMGATRGGIMRIFVLQGLTIGGFGTLFGVLGGWVVCQLIEKIDFGLDPSVYKISALAIDMRLSEIVTIALVAVTISFLATLYPSWRAGRLPPVEGLRYD
jgi:lipoprotein-releasing system permease protein